MVVTADHYKSNNMQFLAAEFVSVLWFFKFAQENDLCQDE
jgi:hypothetical protein